IKISGEPSASVATLTSDANGWPVLRSMVASVPARVVRSSALAVDLASKSAAGAFSGRRSGIEPGNGAVSSALAIRLLRLSLLSQQLPRFCLVWSHFRPYMGFKGLRGRG